MRILRSLLYVPGNQPRMLSKAPTLGADALLLDLEDSVPLAEKPYARRLVAEAVKTILPGFPGLVFVRVNALSTGLTAVDVEAVVQPGLAGISLPKVDSVGDVETANGLLEKAEEEHGLGMGSLALIVNVETALGLVRAYETASASRRVVGLVFGSEDFALNMGLPRDATATDLAHARAAVAIVARAVGVQAIDIVYPCLDDEEGLELDTQAGRRMGYQGKQVIHPRQVPVVNRVLIPSPKEIAQAERVVRAFEEAETGGRGVIALGGKMVDRPVVERARQVLALARHLQNIESLPGREKPEPRKECTQDKSHFH
jgi:citrate lyase subunit beta/citryl-CoA lyase